jgi:DNA-binding IclR family transcriptional regulator
MSETTTASEKTLLVLEAAMTHGRFSEIVAAVDLPKATVHRILATLVSRDFIQVTGTGEHVPGPKILSLAGIAYDRVDVSTIVQPYVDDLVRRVQCTVHVGVRSGDEIIYLVRTDSDKPYRMPSRVGASIPMHTSGIGKAILARLDDDAVERFANRSGLERRTARSLTTLEALRAEIAEIRRDGHAFDREENVPGVVCIATALRDHTGHSNYGLSISSLALEHTETQLAAMSEDLQKTAAAITHALGGGRTDEQRATATTAT